MAAYGQKERNRLVKQAKEIEQVLQTQSTAKKNTGLMAGKQTAGQGTTGSSGGKVSKHHCANGMTKTR